MAFLAKVTPVILTFNEEANLGRCLSNLTWADEIIVLDSFSTDSTPAICAAHPRVRMLQNTFVSHAAQWTFAVRESDIKTPWVLALDCDYMLTPEAADEINALPAETEFSAFWLRFRYAVFGKVLKSGIYPPVQALYRLESSYYIQDGHTHRLVIQGKSGCIAAHLIHDDRKPLDHWIRSQVRYSRLEALKYTSDDADGLKHWVRTRTPFSPIAVGLYCLFLRGAILEGAAGWLYAAQRMLAEAMVLVARLDIKLTRSTGTNNHG